MLFKSEATKSAEKKESKAWKVAKYVGVGFGGAVLGAVGLAVTCVYWWGRTMGGMD